MVTNKHHDSSLQYIYDFYNDKLIKLAKKYRLKKKDQKILSNMLLDLIFLYDKYDKLSKVFNQHFERIYQNYQNKNYKDLIDFDKINTFKIKWRNKFEQYCPFEFEDENGIKKYMITYGDF
jgi:hypothetical protein